ncbi:MAG: TolC family protein [Phenylobacterium sp.]|uniref:TolC family protein n=1 Tax=Phenylobacterium sp. TaxID=1871053 RepID=UPI00271F3A58|nr:TolC family protein [Phenylobacterium sp.]MDO8913007.1 TolC family protein [Phenylobacterium sp.]MDO9249883.1 TolC family protein [Phenylobacterium sp.]MDP3099338.1 TolC family protein [Phenylobacterium sp.]MDP3631773.1 TolC family protein [Phenylobacterium sp.]MDP3870974.1 TolC family protein [Phenylobacterium sp.]
MRPATFVAGLACLTLAACASARKADIALPTAFEAPQAGSSALDAAALDQWWVQFNDPVLTTLIEDAMARAPDARTAAARLREARATASSGLLGFLPQGNASATTRETNTTQTAGTAVNIPGFSSEGESTASSATFNVSWEVDLFGRIFAVAKAARGDTNQAQASYEGARASLAANIADTYFLARGQAIQLEDARETARIQRGLQQVANVRAERGLGSSSEADRVAGDLAQAEGAAASLEAELKATRRTLLVLVGRGVDPLASIPTPASVGQIPPVPAAVPGQLLARRPDVRQAEAAVRSAAGRLTYAKLAFFPTFTLTPGIGLSRSEQPGFESSTRNWSIGAGVTQPILSIPRLLQELKAQDARTEQAVIAYEKAVQTAYGEADSALTRLDADRRRVGLLADGEVRAARAYEASRVRYAAGIDDLTAALGAEQSWRSTRSALTSAQVQALRRAVQTYKALGGGWPATPVLAQQEAR